MLRGAVSEEDVAGVLGQPRVLGHEAEVGAVGRVEPAEGHVLQAVEVVLVWVVGKLERERQKIHERGPENLTNKL